MEWLHQVMTLLSIDVIMYLCACMFSHIRLFVIPWNVSRQVPLSMGFSRQEYWSGLPFPSSGVFTTQGQNLHLLYLLHWQEDSLPLGPHGKPKNTGVRCHILLQSIFPIQGSNPRLLCLLHCRQILYHGATRNNLLVLLKWNVSVILNS